jgi:hypothetical protein
MLLIYLHDLWYCLPLLILILFFCVGHAYRVNASRSSDDPSKRDFHLGAVFLALFSWPAILIGYVGLFLLSTIVFAVFLVVVTLGLVFIKKPVLLPWLDKTSTRLGNMLLELNTALIYVFLGKESKKPPL